MSIKSAVTEFMGKAIAAAPDKWMPGGTPDPLLTQHKHGSKGHYIGAPVSRIDGPLKVRGAAPFAAEIPITGMLYGAVAFSTIAKGRITELDTAAAEAAPGVHLGTHSQECAEAQADSHLQLKSQSRRSDRPADHAG